LQDNALNEIGHETVIVLPLITNLIDDAFPLRMRISKRDFLEQESDILCDQISAIDTNGTTYTWNIIELCSSKMYTLCNNL